MQILKNAKKFFFFYYLFESLFEANSVNASFDKIKKFNGGLNFLDP